MATEMTGAETMVAGAIEAIRVASFEAPVAHSHTEWNRRIEAILTAFDEQRDAYEMALRIIANGSETGDPVELAKGVLDLWRE